MVISGIKKFTCRHEYIVKDKVLWCHKCEHAKDELPLPSAFQLYFFPIPDPAK